MNMVRSMLKSKKVPNHLWGEATFTAVYILNKSATKRLSGKTPEETWTGIKPDVTHFRVFDSICFRHVPDELRRKLDDKGEQMILVGYHSTGGYKLYDPINKQTVISRDVVIDESTGWDWNTEAENGSTRMLIDLNSNDEHETNTSAASGLRHLTGPGKFHQLYMILMWC